MGTVEHHGPDAADTLCSETVRKCTRSSFLGAAGGVAEQASSSAPSRPSQQLACAYICSFVTFGETDNSGEVKGGFL